MISFLSPSLLRTVRVSTTGSSQDLQAASAGGLWNFLLLSTNDATGFFAHLRFDGTDAEDPASISTTSAIPGTVLFLAAGSPQPVLFESSWKGPFELWAVSSKTIHIGFGHVRTEQNQVQPIPGAPAFRVSGTPVGGAHAGG